MEARKVFLSTQAVVCVSQWSDVRLSTVAPAMAIRHPVASAPQAPRAPLESIPTVSRSGPGICNVRGGGEQEEAAIKEGRENSKRRVTGLPWRAGASGRGSRKGRRGPVGGVSNHLILCDNEPVGRPGRGQKSLERKCQFRVPVEGDLRSTVLRATLETDETTFL